MSRISYSLEERVDDTKVESEVQTIQWPNKGESEVQTIQWPSKGESEVQTIKWPNKGESEVQTIQWPNEGESEVQTIQWPNKEESEVQTIKWPSKGESEVQTIQWPNKEESEVQTMQWPNEKGQTDIQNIIYTETKDRATQTPLKTSGKCRCKSLVYLQRKCIYPLKIVVFFDLEKRRYNRKKMLCSNKNMRRGSQFFRFLQS